jgi:hypothetical protein
MRTKNIMIGLGLAALASACGATAQRAPVQVAGVQCNNLTDADRQVSDLYAAGNVENVQPLYRTLVRGRGITDRYVSGARLYVPAQANTSGAYLERVLSCHAAAAASVHPNDPLHAAAIKDVDVRAIGPRFAIDIEGIGRDDGKAILRTAKALHEGASNVEVRQLSEAPSRTSNL